MTDIAGATLSTATDIALLANPTFLDIKKYELVTSPILKIDRKTTLYKWIYLKGSTMGDGTAVHPAVTSVVKALVVVCGDEQAVTVSPDNEVFNINLEKTASDAWVKYNLDGLFKTISTILPGDECPVTSYLVCNDTLCRASPNETSEMRVISTTGSQTFEINRANEIPLTTFYLGVYTISGNLQTFPLSVEIYKIANVESKMNFPPIFDG